jgi:hypothetical protein
MLPQPPWRIIRGLVGGFLEGEDMVGFGVCDFGFGFGIGGGVGGKYCGPEVWGWFS